MSDQLTDPAWRQQEPPDQEYLKSCPECWSTEICDACVDDHDRKFSEMYDGRTDIGDDELPPY